MSNVLLQMAAYTAILAVLGILLGKYIAKVMNGERTCLSGLLCPVENGVYKILRIDKDEDMSWKKYMYCIIVFSAVGMGLLWLMQMAQAILPLNPEGIGNTSWHLGFNTAASFVTNTNWQAYSGESTLSYFTQMLGLTVQNFVSAAVGIAVLFALIRGFIRVKQNGVGNFYADVTRTVVYILIPLSIVVALGIASQGVPQTFKAYDEVSLLEPMEITDDAGNAVTVTKGLIPLGPAASQIAIKQLGTNGGGFFGVNSAHPFENPTIFSNLLQMLSLLLIPAALCFTFGRNIKDSRQGRAIFAAMLIVLLASMLVVGFMEQKGTPQLAAGGAVDIGAGNMEGKETRFGIGTSATWAVWTTAASNGSVNSMHDSYTPIGGMIPMLLMQLGEVIFGGVGCGLYGMLGFAILTVFVAGLMVGRTPEYLGKKIEPFEMKMAVLVCLATPVAILIGSGIAVVFPGVTDSLNNPGAHGLSEILYAYSSGGGNNGSAFAGFNANTPFLNISIGLIMIFVRFLPMFATLAIAGSLGRKKLVAKSSGTLPTHNVMFVFLLIFIVLLVGALSFFPALSLGPVAEYFEMTAL